MTQKLIIKELEKDLAAEKENLNSLVKKKLEVIKTKKEALSLAKEGTPFMESKLGRGLLRAGKVLTGPFAAFHEASEARLTDSVKYHRDNLFLAASDLLNKSMDLAISPEEISGGKMTWQRGRILNKLGQLMCKIQNEEDWKEGESLIHRLKSEAERLTTQEEEEKRAQALSRIKDKLAGAVHDTLNLSIEDTIQVK